MGGLTHEPHASQQTLIKELKITPAAKDCYFRAPQILQNEKYKFEGRVDAMRICYAVSEGDSLAVTALLEGRVDPNCTDYSNQAPLHLAALTENSVQIINLLIAYKAQVNALNKETMTPLNLAVQNGNFGAVDVLRAAGGKIEEMAKNNTFSACPYINREEVEMCDEISTTLKSQVFMAKWRETAVVAKFAKLPIQGSRKECQQEDSTTADCDEDALMHKELLHEIGILQSLRHPDLVMFLGACLDSEPVMFLTEYMPGGNLEQYYTNKRSKTGQVWRPDMRRLVTWSQSLCRALSFLHSGAHPIIHRDLKPMNLLLTKTLDLKVTDFGISKLISGERTSEAYKMTGGVGSWRYMAPEVVRHQCYTEKVDIYSAALILYFMSSGKKPFHELGRDPELILKEYLKGNEPRPQVNECHPGIRSVLKDAWDARPENRPSAADLVHLLHDVPICPAACGCSMM